MKIDLKKARVFADGLDHPECVAAHPDGTFYAGGEGGQIYHVSSDGKKARPVANTGGFILGVAISPDRRWLAACDLKQKCVWRLDLKAKRLRRFADSVAGAPALRIPNHLAFARDGRLFVSDSGAFDTPSGRIFCFDADHSGRGRVWHEGPFKFANGIALSPTEDALHVVCSLLPGIVRIPLRADGSAGRATRFGRFPRRTCPDGLAFAADGTLLVSCYAPNRIYALDRQGRATLLVDDWFAHTLSNPTNLAFCGPRLDELIVANLGRWHLTRLPLGQKGAPLACFPRAHRAKP